MARLTRAWNRYKTPQPLPLAASYASRKPRMPYSPPEMPTITSFFTASGARRHAVSLCVIGNHDIPDHVAGFAIECYQVRIDSSMKSRSPSIASPRFTWPQQR
jgi:hypothetical protein